MKPKIKSEYPINENILNRWSARKFKQVEISDKDIETLYEAARWAASCFNEQPWRFIVAKKGTEKFDKILSTLVEANQDWAKEASVLTLNVVKKSFTKNGKPNNHAVHDLGLALGNLSIQATEMGYNVHHMAGINPNKAHEIFNLDDDLEVITGMSIGVVADENDLSEDEKKSEYGPQERKPLSELFI